MAVKRIKRSRTNYRKEKKKVEESTRSGARSNEYDIMRYLDADQGNPRSSRSNIGSDRYEVGTENLILFFHLLKTKMSPWIAHLKKAMTAPRKQCHVHLYRQVTLDHPDESEMHQI
nr:unnamed protein product [Callosobruchus analis]